MRGLVLDAGPAQLLSGRRSEAPGFGASDESAEDWSQADSQSPWGRYPFRSAHSGFALLASRENSCGPSTNVRVPK